MKRDEKGIYIVLTTNSSKCVFGIEYIRLMNENRPTCKYLPISMFRPDWLARG